MQQRLFSAQYSHVLSLRRLPLNMSERKGTAWLYQSIIQPGPCHTLVAHVHLTRHLAGLSAEKECAKVRRGDIFVFCTSGLYIHVVTPLAPGS